MEITGPGGAKGFGHTEQFFLGPYAPYGWTEAYATTPVRQES